ncbi:cytochrome P450 oxidoreductase [Aspergillus ellipticus CBS 707.79]|uniref:Cytochrome P450 oxidoreductase n=1 Tax=Aspergillus ellipticus CBS 707.79 TaxID=1448320 RepID=A0A319D7R2_9EURO|nr:cytochrome P450 oxidoreductase [Aspergillus ellipticus CBS 707.79]
MLFEFLVDISQTHPSLGAAIVALGVLVAWRFWRFSIQPSPGHGGAFFSNTNALLSRAQEYSKTDHSPFTLTIANSLMYVISRPQDIAEAYRNTETLSFNEFAQTMMRAFGNTESCIKATFTPLSRDKPGFPNPRGKSLATLVPQMPMHQLFPGDNLDFLEKQFLDCVTPRLNMAALRPYQVRSSSTQGGNRIQEKEDALVLPLMEWCSDVFTRAGQQAYFGPELANTDLTLAKSFFVFDDLSWQLLYQYPDFLAGEMRASRDAIQRALTTYVQLPQDQRHGDAWFTKAVENEMRALGIKSTPTHRKISFWLLTYLLHHGLHYINAIRTETNPAFLTPTNPLPDLTYLHNHCPLLDALWNETIRMSTYSASVRLITADTPLGGKILRKGNRVLLPSRQLHFDPAFFGADSPVDEFRPERFVGKGSRNLARGDVWRPFGGGVTMCPGRYVAKRFVLLFVVLVLRRFDVEMVERRLPVADVGKPVVGTVSMREGEEVWVRVTERV